MMSGQDPFSPLSKKKIVGYTIGATLLLIIAAVLLGSMDGGFSAWQLLRTTCIGSIPAIAVLSMVAWLTAGKRSASDVGPANVKFPVRLLKTLPYIGVMIALFYLMKAVEAFQLK